MGAALAASPGLAQDGARPMGGEAPAGAASTRPADAAPSPPQSSTFAPGVLGDDFQLPPRQAGSRSSFGGDAMAPGGAASLGLGAGGDDLGATRPAGSASAGPGASPAAAAAGWEATPRMDGDPVDLGLKVPAAPKVGDRITVVVELKLDEGFHVYSPEETTGEGVTVDGAPGAGIRWSPARFPKGKKKVTELLGQVIESVIYEDGTRVELEGVVEDAGALGRPVQVKVGYQACSESACLLAQERVVEGAWGSDTTRGTAAAEPTRAAPGAPVPQPVKGGFADDLEGGLVWALLVAYLWGLFASLSPCVYPMIPVTIAFFGSQDPDSKATEGAGKKKKVSLRTVALAVTYVAGIALSYALAGLGAAWAGRDLGSLLVHPVVVGVVSVTLIAMGLSLFGLFEMALPSAVVQKLDGGEGKGFGNAFFTGAVMGLVAAPCVGPFAASILLFVATSGDMVTGFLALGSFGLGLGTLFLVLALGAASLPRSGVWMESVKRFFGYVLIGSSLYFLQFVLPPATVLPLAGAYLAVGGVIGGALDPADSPGARAGRGVTLVALAAGLYLVVAGMSQVVPIQGAGGTGTTTSGVTVAAPAALRWQHDLDQAKAAAMAEGKPLFLDFYADWCIPCKRMDAEVFSDPEVQAELSHFVVGKIDCTRPEMPGAIYKNQVLKSQGMPLLSIHDAAGAPRPDLSHDGYLGKAEFLALLRRARAALT